MRAEASNYSTKFDHPFTAWLYALDTYDDEGVTFPSQSWVARYGKNLVFEHDDGAVTRVKYPTVMQAIEAFGKEMTLGR